MAAKPTQRKGWELFAHPAQPNQRRYEALRAYLYEGASLDQAAGRFGYTPATLNSLARDLRAGKLALFAPAGKPGRKHAPKKDRARARVIQLRRDGLSVYEISTRLAVEGIGLNRTGVGQILREEGFGRLLRDPADQASTSPATSGRDTRLPKTSVLDFDAFPQRVHTAMAGLLLAIPDLVALDLPALVHRAGYPGTNVVPATGWILSLLALKLTGTRRVSHVDDLLGDPAAGLFAGLGVLPKKTALTDYSYRLAHHQQRALLAALDAKMIASGLASSEEAIFDLDFHAVMHWGDDPALERHYVPRRSQRTRSVLTFFAQDSGTHNLVYAGADISKATQAREVLAFCDHWKAVSGADPHLLILDSKVTTQPVLGELNQRGVKFLTLRPRSPPPGHPDQPAPAHRLHAHHPGPLRQAHQAKSARDDRGEAHQLPGHRPPAGRHRPGPRHCHRHHHQRPPQASQGTDRTLRAAHDHRAAPGRDHPRVLPGRPVQRRQPQRRPGRRAVRARPGGHRGLPPAPARQLRHRHPRHPATPLPRHPRRNHQHRRHDHRQDRPAGLLTRPSQRRPPCRHHRPLVGRPPTPLRLHLTTGPIQLRGNRR